MRIDSDEQPQPREHAETTKPLPAGAPRGVAVLGYQEPPHIHTKPVLDDVLREEANFANADYAPHANSLDINPVMYRKYTDPHELWDWRQLGALALGDVAGKDLLDYGCGMGEESIYFAKRGARVTAIDISEIGISTLQRRAAHHKVHVRAYEMRADPTSFDSESFDRIHGMGILHHVGIEPALAEVWRLLRPGGVGVFLEPMGDHAQIERAKTYLMKHARFLGDFDHVTDHEHNLTWDEITQATQRFAHTTTYPFHLLYRIKRLLPARWLDTARRIDAAALALWPKLQRYAGAVVIRVVK